MTTSSRVNHLLVLVLFLPGIGICQTYLAGTVPGGTWTKEGSPYVILGGVTVEDHLYIEPGVTVIFDYEDGMVSWLQSDSGYIHAFGDVTDSIRFTSEGQSSSFLAGTIEFRHGSTPTVPNIFKYCVFENRPAAYSPIPCRGNQLDSLLHCTFRNLTIGIQAGRYSADLHISRCRLHSMSSAILGADDSLSNIAIYDCLIEECWSGILWQTQGSVTVRNTVIRNMDFEAATFFTPPRTGGTLEVILGDDPMYCNSFYNNNLHWPGSGANIKYSNATPLRARYNFWGTTIYDSVSAWMDGNVESSAYLPFTDENCLPVTVLDYIPIAKDPLFQIYPNPSSGLVNIQLLHDAHGEIEYEVFNSHGASVRYLRTESKALSMHGLTPGTYYILARTQTGTFNSGLVVE